ncbi:MAG: DUF5017 domain-containing protein [Bacteroidales bacterium]|nr:DUF5017 domain-containing protein [Bacteroidales bacterium]
MRKLTLLMVLMIAFTAAKAQLPSNWTDDSGIETFKESTTVHGGDYSCGVMVMTDVQANCDFANDSPMPVTPGATYKISFWANTSEHVRITAVVDYDAASTEWPGTYVGPATAGWEQYTFEGTIPDGASTGTVRLRFYDVSGFNPPETQYVDDVAFESPIGTPLTVVNGDFETWGGTIGEPSNYPTEFTATASGVDIVLSWVDAVGDPLPGNYLIKASTQDNITPPVDGIYVTDDLNLADGSGAANVAYGEESFLFPGLEPLTTYYFKMFPYNNSGLNVDYKTDGTAPSAQATIGSIVILETQNFDADWGGWTRVSVTGEQEWGRDNTNGINGTACAKMSGFSGGAAQANEDWLISPSMDFTTCNDQIFSFFSAVGYSTPQPQLTVHISTDYDGGGDPSAATWTQLNPMLPVSPPNWVWTNSGVMDVSSFNGDNVHVAFLYISGNDAAATWEIDNVMISGEGEITPEPEPSNYPADFAAAAQGQTINLTWVDATGDVLPEHYLLLGSDADNIVAPQDGQPVENDLDFGDGTAAINISYGTTSFSFAELTGGQTYYFKIFPYNNAGVVIDYKNDGNPPMAQATTDEEVLSLFTDFNEDWGGWTPVSLVGPQTWIRTTEFGIENSPCAKMSGFGSGSAVVNEDWLLSPAYDLAGMDNMVESFYSATKFAGPALRFKVSTNYDGTGNPNDATWDDLTDLAAWSTNNYEWTESGNIDLAAYGGSTVRLAFVYYSSAEQAATWEIDNVLLAPAQVTGEPSNYPTAFAAEAQDQNITITWTDATGDIVPEGYLVMISNADEFTAPVDGTPIADDLDLSDGMGAKNVMPGVQQVNLNDLEANTTYYAVIFPYTNSGTDINYKTDGTAPHTEATTGEAAADLRFTTFNESWENWTPISVVGDQVWGRDNTYGIDGTACARMSGYANDVSNVNEDWLVSPAIDLTGITNAALMFYSAVAYTGDPLQVLVSADYDGSGNLNDFTWDDFTAQAQWPAGDPFWVWTHSGSLSLQDYANQTIWVAFKFISDAVASKTWEVDNIRIQGTSSINDPESYLLDLYPNPAKGLINYDLKEAPTAIDIYSVTGQLVYSAKTPASNGSINLQQMQKGLYLVRFILDEQGTSVVRRIIIE